MKGENAPGPKPTRTWIPVALSIGAVLFVSCCSCGGGAYLYYKLTVPPNLTGRWKQDFGPDVLEFRADGTGTLETNGFGSYPFTYHFVNFCDLTLNYAPAPANAPIHPGEERWQVSYFGQEMQMENLNRRGFYKHMHRIN